MHKYQLTFVKGGDGALVKSFRLDSESAAFEMIRDRLGMGWILISLEVNR